MNTHPKHTPTPWHVGMKPGPMVYGPQGEQVVSLNVMLDITEVSANAKHITHCVNNHEALVDALIQAQQSLVYLAPESFDDAEHKAAWEEKLAKIAQVIAQAEGK